jgi:diaminopimelate epimerase
MTIDFHKMQALGNDFVIIECRYCENPGKLFEKDFITKISHRIYGVGCDQLVVFYRENCFVHSSFFNNDGSRAEICGNASRCLGKLMKRRYGIARFPMVAAGKDYDVQVNGDGSVSVNIGFPSAEASIIGLSGSINDPFNLDLERDLQITKEIFAGFHVLKVACLSVGNPHLAVFLDKMPPIEQVVEIGGLLSANDLFTNGVNVSFVTTNSEDVLEQCSFERGTGLTLACGSGACATTFLAIKNGLVKAKKVIVKQRGGSLTVVVNENATITQTGPADYVFSGRIDI